MIRASLVCFVFAALASTGCSKKGDGAAAGPTKLPKLGLQIDVPGSVSVGDAVMGEGHMLQGASIGAMQIEVADKKKTLDDAKGDADMYSPKDLKADALPDGYAVTFNNTGSMGKNFFVDVQRDIAGKTYHCSTTGSDAGQAEAVLAACKSLRK